MSNRWSYKKKNNKVIYTILNITENTKERDCILADKKNEKKYRETIEKLGNATKVWENTGVMLNMEVPLPPSPNNYERLLDFKKKNVLRPAMKQSEATIYLFQRGYVLGTHYEAYQAIEMMNKLETYHRQEQEAQMPQPDMNPESLKVLGLNISKNQNPSQVPLINQSNKNYHKTLRRKSISAHQRKSIIPEYQNISNSIKPPLSAPPSYSRQRNQFFPQNKLEPMVSNYNQPTAPPNPLRESNSSVDSLFSDDEIQQFDRQYQVEKNKDKLENKGRRKRFEKTLRNLENRTNHTNHPNIYPSLNNIESNSSIEA